MTRLSAYSEEQLVTLSGMAPSARSSRARSSSMATKRGRLQASKPAVRSDLPRP